MKKFLGLYIIALTIIAYPTVALTENGSNKREIKAIYVSLADHYAGILAFEKYRDEMHYADYVIKKMDSWPELRAYFMSGEADIAFILSPMAIDMFLEKPNFRWVGLMHRDGNALAINGVLGEHVKLHPERLLRKPTNNLSDAWDLKYRQLLSALHISRNDLWSKKNDNFRFSN